MLSPNSQGLSKVDSKKALDATLDAISSEVKKGGKVVLVGFGTFLFLKEVQEKVLTLARKKPLISRLKKQLNSNRDRPWPVCNILLRRQRKKE